VARCIGQIWKSFRTPLGDEFAGSGSLFEHAFKWGGRPGRERHSRRDIPWIWETLFHGAMMSKFC